MAPIEKIITDWRVRANQFAPKVWAGHYKRKDDGYQILGELSLPDDTAECVMWGLMPFCLAPDVTDAVVVLDLDSELWVVRMSTDGQGVRTTFWIVQPDSDEWGFVARKKLWTLGSIPEGLGVLANARPKARYSYEAAVLAVSNEYAQR